jgi:hypothetical protein
MILKKTKEKMLTKKMRNQMIEMKKKVMTRKKKT